MKRGWRLSAMVLAIAFVAAPARTEEPLPPQVSAVPIPDGQVAAAIARLDAVVQEAQKRTGVPGVAVAVVHDGELVYARGFGVREIGKPELVDADTAFQLASVSKSVGATVVATQVSAGKVSWKSRMAELLPWFKLKDPAATAMLTVGDLYSHRSGLPEHAGDDLEDLGYDQRAILERLRYAPLKRFRDNYDYTNFGLTAAALAVAEAVGTDWNTLSEQAIYHPLGMTGTSSRFSDYIAHDNRAVPHVKVGDVWEARYQRRPDAQTPAGGVSSTANDMAQWMRMVLQDGTFRGVPIVAPEALLPALSPQSVSSPPYAPDARAAFYGFGVGVSITSGGRVQFSHSGAFTLGAATNYVLLPSEDVGIVVLSNAAPVGAVEVISQSFMDLVQFGKITRDWYAAVQPLAASLGRPFGEFAGKAPPINTTRARALEQYAGTYDNEYYGPIDVTLQGDELTLTAGPARRLSWPLRHWDGDTFVFEPGGENAPEGSRSSVRFRMGQAGAEAVTVEFWDQDEIGTFTRE